MTQANLNLVPTLETERLTLRPWDLWDAPRVQNLHSTPEISATTLNIPFPYPNDGAVAWITKRLESAGDGGSFYWVIERQGDKELLGSLALGINATHFRGTLGYWLGVPFWNNGYMSEAVRAVVEWSLTTLQLHRVEAHCFTFNPASARVLEHAGMVLEGTLRGYVFKNGEPHDLLSYARIASNDFGPA